MLVFSSAEMTKSFWPSGLPSHMPWYRTTTRDPLSKKSGSRGKIHGRWVQGRSPSSWSHSHNVVALIVSTTPFSITTRRISSMLNREKGKSNCAGSSQATALTDAIWLGGKTRRPARPRSLFERIQAFLEEPLPNTAHKRSGAIKSGRDRRALHPITGTKNDSSANDLSIRVVRRPRSFRQHRTF